MGRALLGDVSFDIIINHIRRHIEADIELVSQPGGKPAYSPICDIPGSFSIIPALDPDDDDGFNQAVDAAIDFYITAYPVESRLYYTKERIIEAEKAYFNFLVSD